MRCILYRCPTPNGAIDADDQFHPARPSAAAVVAHASDDVADQHVAPRPARLGEHPLLAAGNAGNAHEPRREGTEWFTQSFLARRQREIAIAAPVAHGLSTAGYGGGSAGDLLRSPSSRRLASDLDRRVCKVVGSSRGGRDRTEIIRRAEAGPCASGAKRRNANCAGGNWCRV